MRSSITATDLREAIDAAPIGRLQWQVAILLGCVFVLEGMDLQSAAYSAPLIMALWHLGKLEVAPLLAAAPIGMAVGTLAGSWAGDRLGRKPALAASVALFGVLTIACAVAAGPRSFIACRFVSGIGFGAAIPVAVTMMGEWMPRRVAGKAISITTIGVPGGAIIGAMVAGWFLPAFGWRWYFGAIGALCLLFSLLLGVAMPESPSFLALKGRAADLAALFRRGWRHPVALGSREGEAARIEPQATRLLGAGHRRTSLGLWIASFSVNLATFMVNAWIVVVLTGLHLPLAAALRGPIAFGLSSIAGALSVGWLIAWLGSRVTMLTLAALGVAGAAIVGAAVGTLGMGSALLVAVFAGLAMTGIAIGALVPLAYVVATSAYDTAIRSRGVGIMATIGRLGAILSGFVGGAVLTAASPAAFFALVALLIVLIGLSAWVIDEHVRA